MGEMWEDRRVSHRWHRMSKNRKVPKELRQGGEERKPKPEVEYKTSAWFKRKKKTKPKLKGMPPGPVMEYKASISLTWIEQDTWPRTCLSILGSEKDWSPSLEVIVKKKKVLVAQLCSTLGDPMDYSLPGSFVHGILQALILGWVAIPFSRESSWPRNQT